MGPIIGAVVIITLVLEGDFVEADIINIRQILKMIITNMTTEIEDHVLTHQDEDLEILDHAQPPGDVDLILHLGADPGQGVEGMKDLIAAVIIDLDHILGGHPQGPDQHLVEEDDLGPERKPVARKINPEIKHTQKKNHLQERNQWIVLIL